MKKYWIIENGKPIGPFTSAELKVRRDFTATLPVWYSGLPDWTTVGELAELACLLPIPEETAGTESATTEETQNQGQQQEEAQQQPQYDFGFNSQWIRPQHQPVNSRSNVMSVNGNQPPTYIGWNILMTICCCLPLGLIGIVYGNMVTRRWMAGDTEGAKKASEIAAWCLILSIVMSLVTWPFQMIYSFI